MKAPSTITVTLRGQTSRPAAINQAVVGTTLQKQEETLVHALQVPDTVNRIPAAASKLSPQPIQSDGSRLPQGNESTSTEKTSTRTTSSTAPVVTTNSPPKTLYVMSDAKLSALTRSVSPGTASTPLKSVAIPTSISVSSGPVAFTTSTLGSTVNPACTMVLSKVGPVLHGMHKAVILTPTKNNGSQAQMGDRTGPLIPSHSLDTVGRVPSVLEDNTVFQSREPLTRQGMLTTMPSTTIITLAGSAIATPSIISTIGPLVGPKPQ